MHVTLPNNSIEWYTVSMELTDKHVHGLPCRACQGTIRYKASGRCVACLNRTRKKPSPEKAALYQKRWREKNVDVLKAKSKALWATQKEKVQEWKRKSTLRHPETWRAYSKKWREENYERFLATQRAYKKRNAEKVAASHKQWQERHHDRVRVYRANAKANRRERESGALSPDLAEKLLELQRHRCAVCAERLSSYELDHIIPLYLGGPHCDSNIQLLCPPCNRLKSYKPPEVFMREQGKLL